MTGFVLNRCLIMTQSQCDFLQASFQVLEKQEYRLDWVLEGQLTAYGPAMTDQ